MEIGLRDYLVNKLYDYEEKGQIDSDDYKYIKEAYFSIIELEEKIIKQKEDYLLKLSASLLPTQISLMYFQNIRHHIENHNSKDIIKLEVDKAIEFLKGG